MHRDKDPRAPRTHTFKFDAHITNPGQRASLIEAMPKLLKQGGAPVFGYMLPPDSIYPKREDLGVFAMVEHSRNGAIEIAWWQCSDAKGHSIEPCIVPHEHANKIIQIQVVTDIQNYKASDMYVVEGCETVEARRWSIPDKFSTDCTNTFYLY